MSHIGVEATKVKHDCLTLDVLTHCRQLVDTQGILSSTNQQIRSYKSNIKRKDNNTL